MSLERITIKVARTIAGLSQQKLAEKMGVSRDTVAKWEADKMGISGKNLQRLCEVTGFKAEDIILPCESTK